MCENCEHLQKQIDLLAETLGEVSERLSRTSARVTENTSGLFEQSLLTAKNIENIGLMTVILDKLVDRSTS